MSWITELADKAEGLLNKIDQNTAALTTPIQDNGISTTLDVMRKSLSNSTNSLKSTLSPARQRMKTTASDRNLALPADSELVAINIDAPETALSLATTSASSSSNELAQSVVASQRSTPADEAFASAPYAPDAPEDAANATHAQVHNDNSEYLLVRTRMLELESFNKQLTTERDKLVEQLGALQTSSSNATQSISELEANYAKLYQEYTKLQAQLELQQAEAEKCRVELLEYRSKAQRTLQMKEALIAELKAGNAHDTSINSSETETRCLQIEYNTLKQDYAQEQAKTSKLLTQLAAAQSDMQALQREQAELLKKQQTNEEHLNRQLRIARERNVVLESEQRLLTQDISALRHQLNDQLSTAAARLQQKQQELESAQHAQATQTAVKDSRNIAEEYEERMRKLTQTLVEKQSTIERLTSDGNALRIQLENMQQQLQKTVRSATQNTQNALLLSTAENAKTELPLLIKPNPFDNRVARRVKRAYSSVDSAGIRLGIFLRRYPLMRVVVLAYVLLLHIWVMLVMIWSTPN